MHMQTHFLKIVQSAADQKKSHEKVLLNPSKDSPSLIVSMVNKSVITLIVTEKMKIY